MKKLIVQFLLLTAFQSVVFCQRFDNFWAQICYGPTPFYNAPTCGTNIEFSTSPPQITFFPYTFLSRDGKVTMSNENGTPLFYSNGYKIYHLDGSVLINGDSLAPIADQSTYHNGYWQDRAMMAIPRPGHKDEYYMIILYMSVDFSFPPKIILNHIKYDSGSTQGKVILKNKTIYTGHDYIDFFNMTKHANGRDWWIVFSDIDANAQTRTFHSIYVGPDTTYIAQSQMMSGYEPVPQNAWIEGNYTYHRIFSPDGNYLISLDLTNGIRIHPFDRCIGQLGSLITFPFLPGHWSTGGVSISPNSRFLYVSNTQVLMQYDLQASNIAESRDTVGIYDNFQDFLTQPTLITSCQLGPDGKIYYFNTGQTFVHYISKPNKKGKACAFIQRGLEMPTPANGLPFYPNYRLGPIDNTICDSLGISNKPLADFWWFADSTQTVEFMDNSFYEPQHWLWNFGDGSTSQDTSPFHLFPSAGFYNVCLIVGNQYGSDTICKTLYVGVSSVSNVDSFQPISINILPNPVHSWFQISYQIPSSPGLFTLHDAIGRLVESRILREKDATSVFNIEDLPNGLYFYKIQSQGRDIKSGKIIKH